MSRRPGRANPYDPRDPRNHPPNQQYVGYGQGTQPNRDQQYGGSQGYGQGTQLNRDDRQPVDDDEQARRDRDARLAGTHLARHVPKRGETRLYSDNTPFSKPQWQERPRDIHGPRLKGNDRTGEARRLGMHEQNAANFDGSNVTCKYTTPENKKLAARQSRIDGLQGEEKKEQEQWAQYHLWTNANTCPASYAWYRVEGAYRCHGGHHAVTDQLLAEGKDGYFWSNGDPGAGGFTLPKEYFRHGVWGGKRSMRLDGKDWYGPLYGKARFVKENSL